MRSDPPVAVLLLVAAWIFYGFGYSTLWSRLTLEVDGVLVARTPEPPSPRANADYVIRGSDGHDRHYYAGPTDASLPRDLTVGTQIRKRRWSLGYELDGRYVDDFPAGFYGGVLAVGVGSLWGAFVQWRAGNRRSRAEIRNADPESKQGIARNAVDNTSSNNIEQAVAPTIFVVEPAWALEARERDEARRLPPWLHWVSVAGLVVWLIGIGMFFTARQRTSFRRSDPATGDVYELNNHGDSAYVTRDEYWKIHGTLYAGFALVLSPAVANMLVNRRRP